MATHSSILAWTPEVKKPYLFFFFPNYFYYSEIHITWFIYLVVKNLHSNAGDIRDEGSILVWEDLLEEGVVTHSSVLAWEIPWTEEPDRL